ncbi:F-box domain containing protein [Tanacetum coccineum]
MASYNVGKLPVHCTKRNGIDVISLVWGEVKLDTIVDEVPEEDPIVEVGSGQEMVHTLQMSDNIPFDIQMDIMNQLPVKSLLQFRTVSKQWKSYIDIDDNFAFTPINVNFNIPLSKPIASSEGQAVIGGKIFWVGSEKFYGDDGISYKIYMLVSFDLITHQFQLIDMPEHYMRFIYAWALEINGGEVSSYRMLFSIPYPANLRLKLLVFDKDEEPIAEANDMHNIPHWLQVFNPTIERFQNVGVEANGGSFFIGPYKESLVLLTERNNELM